MKEVSGARLWGARALAGGLAIRSGMLAGNAVSRGGKKIPPSLAVSRPPERPFEHASSRFEPAMGESKTGSEDSQLWERSLQ